ncbi:ion channel inhibitory toxin protein (macronuclear) [Tetrahymena thermophila SB210]|uniref:Ion channel inhibitory toxin protein n=1 Tax=Tetrahymena thermophila (strain SB210) TaxID=312017 RepID=W7X7A4_TETTS|nr:ion channel inhibitory toxin protein [Tetrahymena thermophila SB210]EWS75275.1 ion channel inhibitory toxin protein [Tetrahymena thermophila SB210]|eukprot:XP_012652266.1 ion channel inhibitory toxin protein [Tetrahymena thermophila SB210]
MNTQKLAIVLTVGTLILLSSVYYIYKINQVELESDDLLHLSEPNCNGIGAYCTNTNDCCPGLVCSYDTYVNLRCFKRNQ